MSFITHETPQSSNIERIAYDPDTLIVRVAFRRKGGVAIWEYMPVPEHEYNLIKNADSVGAAVNAYLIKGPYTSRKLTEGAGA